GGPAAGHPGPVRGLDDADRAGDPAGALRGVLLHVQPRGAVRLGAAGAPRGVRRRGGPGAVHPYVRDLLDRAEAAGQLFPAALLPAVAGGDADGVLDGLVERDAADGAQGGGSGPGVADEGVALRADG